MAAGAEGCAPEGGVLTRAARGGQAQGSRQVAVSPVLQAALPSFPCCCLSPCDGREHRWQGAWGRVVTKVGAVLGLWHDCVLWGFGILVAPRASLPSRAFHTCPARVTTSGQPPLTSGFPVTVVLTQRVVSGSSSSRAPACALGASPSSPVPCALCPVPCAHLMVQHRWKDKHWP